MLILVTFCFFPCSIVKSDTNIKLRQYFTIFLRPYISNSQICFFLIFEYHKRLILQCTLFFWCLKILTLKIIKRKNCILLNCFTQDENGALVASDLFHIFTQSINPNLSWLLRDFFWGKGVGRVKLPPV